MLSSPKATKGVTRVHSLIMPTDRLSPWRRTMTSSLKALWGYQSSLSCRPTIGSGQSSLSCSCQTRTASYRGDLVSKGNGGSKSSLSCCHQKHGQPSSVETSRGLLRHWMYSELTLSAYPGTDNSNAIRYAFPSSLKAQLGYQSSFSCSFAIGSGQSSLSSSCKVVARVHSLVTANTARLFRGEYIVSKGTNTNPKNNRTTKPQHNKAAQTKQQYQIATPNSHTKSNNNSNIK